MAEGRHSNRNWGLKRTYLMIILYSGRYYLHRYLSVASPGAVVSLRVSKETSQFDEAEKGLVSPALVSENWLDLNYAVLFS